MDTVELAVDDGLALIWLNRPERLNAVVDTLVRDLCAALEQARRDDVGAVVLAGRGRAFCAGHDLKEPTGDGDSRARLERLQEVTRRLRGLPQPVIAAVQGYAIGAGAEFALGCDLVLAADDATFQFPEVGLGLSVTGAASRLLPLTVGPLLAKQLLLLGERIDAERARELGLVNGVLARDELMDNAVDWAARIARQPATANTLAKRALDHGIDASVATAFEVEVGHALVTEGTTEATAAAHAFRERR